MKFFSRLKNRHVRSSWAWRSCNQPKTLSFRVTTANSKIKHNNEANNNVDNVVDDVILKNINSALVSQTPDSFFTESLDSASFSTASEISRATDPIEIVIRGLRSDRLIFDPDEAGSIFGAKLAAEATTTIEPLKNSVVLTVDSKDPYMDFRKSMEEMVVETLGVEDWESLEDLLCWYLKANAKSNHEHIVEAFVDLLFDLAVPNSPCSQDYPHCNSGPSSSSPLSLYSSCSANEVEEKVGSSGCSFYLAQVEDEITAASSSD